MLKDFDEFKYLKFWKKFLVLSVCKIKTESVLFSSKSNESDAVLKLITAYIL